MNIALISHDAKKELMDQFCIAYSGILNKHNLFSTAMTGKRIIDSTGLKVQRFLRSDQGGVQQIAARIACNEIDMLIFFRDSVRQNDVSSKKDSDLFWLCDAHNIPYATNIATAEVLIHGLGRGDLEWRNMINVKQI